MSKFFEKIRANLPNITVWSFFIISAIIIMYLFPHEGKFRYEFKKNSPWMHDDIQAPFDFPIYKSDAVLQFERDSILNNFLPYFSFDAYQIPEQRVALNAQFNQQWLDYSLRKFNIANDTLYFENAQYENLRKLQADLQNAIDSLLEKVYLKGIIDLNTYYDNTGKELTSIIIVKGNIAEEYNIDDLYTPKSAYETINLQIAQLLKSKNSRLLRRYKDFIDAFDINKFLVVNIVYDEETSNKVKTNLMEEISLYQGMMQEGQLIVSKGDIITPEKFRILESLKTEYELKLGYINTFSLNVGNLVITLVALLLIYLFFSNFRPEILKDKLKILFILLMVVLIIFVASITKKLSLISFYVIPFAILPIILRTFYDERIALFIHVITMLLVSFFVPNSFEFVLLNILAGMVAIFSLTSLYRRSRLIISAFLIVLSYSVVYFGMAIVQEGKVSGIELQNFAWFGINGILILISYPLIYVFEKSFGFLSDATLMELSDTNQLLLRKLSEIAPGTFQHSMQVANLAEDAAYRLGGNALLIRAGALYHDIGKMVDPIYFIENQTSGVNPHDNLEFEESADKIISHVSKGVEMAKKHNLPEQIIDFIKTHHGTTTVQYFYKSYIKKYPEEDVDVNRFSYPGPTPITKEMAILMMADAVEAASRSLTHINDVVLEELIDSIIDKQQKEEQFNNANITFKEITTIKEVFKKRLRNIYHVRISYPK
ncbi:MAG: HDIG domain-containing protein [Bacteroidales bacterium]|nr:HDIG domain-containing protein [Bacteroidales bacterium]